MNRRSTSLLLLIPLLASAALGSDASGPAPWEKPRSLEEFQKLLDHSPFSLPTAEESSPLAERFAITGIITVGDEEEIFVFDRTDQSRILLTKKPNDRNMSLVSLIREEGSSIPRANIRVGGEAGTIGFLEASKQPPGAPPAPGSPAAGSAGPAQGLQAVQLPNLPPLPQRPASAPPTRRIIRRPVVAPPQP
jgi:hypothetical protein